MTKIFIATHKKYDFPFDDGYQPIHVGKKNSNLNLGPLVIGDDSGDSISELNSSYCELTALYWIWKNSTEDIVGLVHYRRYFSGDKYSIDLHGKKIAASNDFDFRKCTIVVAKKRNYLVTNIKKHYCYAHSQKDLNVLQLVIEDKHPEYIDSFNKIMNGTTLSLYNMFITRRDILDKYCEWLFPILSEVNNKIDHSHYDVYQKRMLGFMAERLLNVWIEHNKCNLVISYRPVVNLEGENLLKKACNLLIRHFLK